MKLDTYLKYHQPRFDYILGLCRRIKPDRSSAVLDVGPGPLTEQLNDYYEDVWSLGFEESGIFADGKFKKKHINFDLNVAGDRTNWIQTPTQFDLIIFSEVIEHVLVRHARVLGFLASLLKLNGIILCTTPNLAAFHKRVRSLLGRTPWHRFESGHVTEFSKDDLVEFGRRAGLSISYHEFNNYFGYDGSPLNQTAARMVDRITGVVPSLRRGQVIVYESCKSKETSRCTQK